MRTGRVWSLRVQRLSPRSSWLRSGLRWMGLPYKNKTLRMSLLVCRKRRQGWVHRRQWPSRSEKWRTKPRTMPTRTKSSKKSRETSQKCTLLLRSATLIRTRPSRPTYSRSLPSKALSRASNLHRRTRGCTISNSRSTNLKISINLTKYMEVLTSTQAPPMTTYPSLPV